MALESVGDHSRAVQDPQQERQRERHSKRVMEDGEERYEETEERGRMERRAKGLEVIVIEEADDENPFAAGRTHEGSGQDVLAVRRLEVELSEQTEPSARKIIANRTRKEEVKREIGSGRTGEENEGTESEDEKERGHWDAFRQHLGETKGNTVREIPCEKEVCKASGQTQEESGRLGPAGKKLEGEVLEEEEVRVEHVGSKASAGGVTSASCAARWGTYKELNKRKLPRKIEGGRTPNSRRTQRYVRVTALIRQVGEGRQSKVLKSISRTTRKNSRE